MNLQIINSNQRLLVKLDDVYEKQLKELRTVSYTYCIFESCLGICLDVKSKTRYDSKRKLLLDYLGGVCARCGSQEDLEIDHIDWRSKSFDISGRTNLSWNRLKEEADKCQLLCYGCHKEKSALDSREQITGSRKMLHGTYWNYRKYRCRCELCVEANSAYISQFKPVSGRKRQKRVCGTYSMYKHGCRCVGCKKANTAYMTQYYKEKGRKT